MHGWLETSYRQHFTRAYNAETSRYESHVRHRSKNSGAEIMTISQEDFQQLQEQLLELRTTNYQLREENNRLKADAKNVIAQDGKDPFNSMNKVRLYESETHFSSVVHRQNCTQCKVGGKRQECR